MPSFTTLYRAVVMLVVGAIVVKCWKLYGPSTEQVKSVVVSAVEMAESTWKGQSPTGDNPRPAADSGGKAPPFANTTPPTAAVPVQSPPAATLTQQEATPAPIAAVPADSSPPSGSIIPPPLEPAAPIAPSTDDRVSALLSRLEKMGVAEPKLAQWGSSGHLYRFCCQAALANSPSYTQHFESVAAEPAIAVEQVVAKVEAWRTAQRGDTMLR